MNLLLGIVSISLVIAAIHCLIAVGLAWIRYNTEAESELTGFHVSFLEYKINKVGVSALNLFYMSLMYVVALLTIQSYDFRNLKKKGLIRFLLEYQTILVQCALVWLASSIVAIALWFDMATAPITFLGIALVTIWILIFFSPRKIFGILRHLRLWHS